MLPAVDATTDAPLDRACARVGQAFIIVRVATLWPRMPDAAEPGP